MRDRGAILHRAAARGFPLADLLPPHRVVEPAGLQERFVSPGLAFAEPAAAPARARRHEVLFCADDTAALAGLTRFVAAALNAGDGAIAVVTEAHRRLLLQELRTTGVDIDGAVERGTWLSFDGDIAPDPARFLEAIDSARAAAAKAGKAHPRVVACGERAGRLWAAGRTAEAIQLERFCDLFPRDVDILCTYPVPEGDEALECICAEHTAVSVG